MPNYLPACMLKPKEKHTRGRVRLPHCQRKLSRTTDPLNRSQRESTKKSTVDAVGLRITRGVTDVTRGPGLSRHAVFVLVQQAVQGDLERHTRVQSRHHVFQQRTTGLGTCLPFTRHRVSVLVRGSGDRHTSSLGVVGRNLIKFNCGLVGSTRNTCRTVNFSKVYSLLDVGPIRQRRTTQSSGDLTSLVCITQLRSDIDPGSRT